MKLYIIANRLPVKVAGTNGKFAFSRSEGGLATGLDSLQTSYEKHWIGWPGICANEEKDQQEINEKLQEMNFHPVFLSEKQIENYYEGYSNSTIWPLCHYFYAYTLYKNCFWQSYQQVNRLFCEEICRLVRPGDKVWIQDYQLMLLPGMLRKIYRIFPSYPVPFLRTFSYSAGARRDTERFIRSRLHCFPHPRLYASFHQCCRTCITSRF